MSLALFLPVRSGSERVVQKNTRSFAGYENGIFELKLNQIKDLDEVDQTIISSNDEKCLEIATSFKDKIKNLVIDERPEHLGNASTKLEDLIIHASKINNCDHILWTHATNPLFFSNNYKAAIKQYYDQLSNGYDSLVSGYLMKEFLIDPENNEIINNKTDLKWPRTQDLAELFSINNAVFLADSERYKMGDRIGVNPYYLVNDKVASLDIDYEEDFLISEAVYEKLNK